MWVVLDKRMFRPVLSKNEYCVNRKTLCRVCQHTKEIHE